MHIIVAGSRSFTDYYLLNTKLALLTHNIQNITIISGAAEGADQLGELWAHQQGHQLIRMAANWQRYGKAAGYKRNEIMAEHAHMLIAFWDGESRGTAHMIHVAHDRGLQVHIVRFTPPAKLPTSKAIPKTAAPKPQNQSKAATKVNPHLIKLAPGNIWSDSKTLAVLTNPTELVKQKGNLKHSYPVHYQSVDYPDVETAYQQLKQNSQVHLNMDKRKALLTNIITAKLQQHPQLVEFIEFNGGVTWLEQCSHFTNARTQSCNTWKGNGRNSAFIRCLIDAYRTLKR